MKTGMIIILSLIALSAGAQTRRDAPSKVEQQSGITVVGNGGDVVECGEDQPLLLLDVYEEIKLPTSEYKSLWYSQISGNADDKMKAVLQKIHKASPIQAQFISKALKQFETNVEWTTEELPDIKDSFEVVLPKNCYIRQLVVQERHNGISRFKINSILWKRLIKDADQEVAVKLHEAIYSEALDLGHENSIGTRALNGAYLTGGYPTGPSINHTRVKNGFTALHTSKEGDTFMRRASQIKSINGDGDNFCGVIFRTGTMIPCEDREYSYIPQYAPHRTMLRGKLIEGKHFNLTFNVTMVSMLTPEVEPAEDVKVEFDGQTYICQKQKIIRMRASDFKPFKGYTKNSKIESCIAKVPSGKLAAHLTQYLTNQSEHYEVTFLYDEDGKEVGIGFKSLDKKFWRIGFSMDDDYFISSYKENWASKIVEMTAERGSTFNRIRNQKYGEAVCEAFSDVKISLNTKPALVMQAALYNSEKCLINGLSLNAFERDEKGQLIAARTHNQALLPFFWGTAVFNSNVKFKDQKVIEGELARPAQGKYKGKMRWLIPGVRYEVVNGEALVKEFGRGATVLDNGNIQKTGTYMLSLPDNTDGINEAEVSDAIMTPGFEFLEGYLYKEATLPVCHLNKETEEFEIIRKQIPARTKLQSRLLKKPNAKNCYYIIEKPQTEKK